MNKIERLRQRAQEFKKEGHPVGLIFSNFALEVLEQLDRDYVPRWKSVTWGVEDFEHQAKQKWEYFTTNSHSDATKWQDVYDEEEFEEALEIMINKHDANYGISWDTVDFYLDEYCLKEKKVYEKNR